MKKLIIPIVSVVFVLAAALVVMQVKAQPASAGKPAAPEQGPTLTVEQKATVKSILAKYRPDSLTAEDARAINDAFRAAGLRAGPGLHDAVQEAGFDPEAISKLAPPPSRPEETGSGEPSPDHPEEGSTGGNDRTGAGGGYSLEQAISDRAQMTTIAFDALAFMTGDVGCNTFLPPGKVSDFFGFQYMRDIDAGEMGHNTSFLTRIANNMLAILNDQQKQQLIALANEQAPDIRYLAIKRFPLIKAFVRLRDGDLPAGTKGLDRDAVKQYSADIYAASVRLAFRRAHVLGGIVRSFDEGQKAELKKLVYGDSRTWPDKEGVGGQGSGAGGLSHEEDVAVMTYASELFSWYAGSVGGDVYFCPEGHGTYFGSFYMKDKPAMGNANYSISTTITGNEGEQFLAALSDPQRKLITALPDSQRKDLNAIVTTRRAIAGQLRRFLSADSVVQDSVSALARRYGELDGEISYLYANAFAAVYHTLTAAQKQELKKLRNMDNDQCPGAYLYSEPVPMPKIRDTDFLFGATDDD